jgi:hypothetical protein
MKITGKMNNITYINNNEKQKIRNIGFIHDYFVRVYTTKRNFFSHQYNMHQAYYFEEDLIDLLKSQGVQFIKIIEIMVNNISNIKEEREFLFPIRYFELGSLPFVHHNEHGLSKQIGIPRELLLHFEVLTKKGQNSQ